MVLLRKCGSGRLAPAEGLARAKHNKQDLSPGIMVSGPTQDHSDTAEESGHFSLLFSAASSNISTEAMIKLEKLARTVN